MAHQEATDEIRNTAALYSLGALTVEEKREFEEHLASCQVCRAEARAFDATVENLPLGIAELQPPPDLRERLLKRIADPRKQTQVVRHTEGKWATPFPGVTVKTLHFDRSTGMMTNLVRMQPNASYPPHRHTAAEQCLVLEGDVCLDDVVLGPGDYSRNDAFSNHGRIHSKGGCLLLIISSAKDELLA